MIRFLLRTLGFVLLAAAFAAVVVDGSRSIAGDRLLMSSLGDTATWLGAARPASALAGWPGPAPQVVAGLLAVPAWIVAAGLGLLLLYAGRPRAPRFSRRRT